jgi:murein endopeptidase
MRHPEARTSFGPSLYVGVLAASLLALPAVRAQAVPPAAASAVAALPETRWIQHRVAPGERIAEIASLYGVSPEDILSWNKLDADKPMIRTGQELRVQTSAPSRSRVRVSYVVKRGDSWASIAKRYNVSLGRLRDQWNDSPLELRAGERIVVFRIPEPAPAPALTPVNTPVPAIELERASVAPLVPVNAGAQSVGPPDRGRLANGVQIPANETLYTLRNLDHSYGSSHAIEQLTQGLRLFREQSGFTREIVIMDMSRKNGGRFPPHASHRTGRDVDIRLPLRTGIADGTIPTQAFHVDWDATWSLVRALVSTGQVRFIFLARQRQKALYDAARRAGEAVDALTELIQYPRRSRTAVVRHARGHVKHIHVRFKCGPLETACVEP